jgi:hypothetical protein
MTETSSTSTDRLISRPAAGRLMGRGPDAVQAMIDRGELNGYRIGGGVMLWEGEVLGYIEQARITPAAPLAPLRV